MSTFTEISVLPMYAPYAQLAIDRIKRYETRPGRVNIRGTIGIYLTKKINIDWVGKRCKAIADLHFGDEWWRDKARGHVIGLVDIVGCYEMTPAFIRCVKKQSPDEIAIGDWKPGRFAWALANPRPLLKPFKVRGNQGWMRIATIGRRPAWFATGH